LGFCIKTLKMMLELFLAFDNLGCLVKEKKRIAVVADIQYDDPTSI